ncbi:MAG: metallophosphoesterase [Methanobacteriaceae archaeon]|jgi:3',5'-cyclic AMP phosphodiesterase CpdA|nr:MAG: phosphohydrolase [Methanobacterium sp. BRmetb2]MCC7557219.1 metallophosphoesterase [Methanobacteriaceae archaeon]
MVVVVHVSDLHVGAFNFRKNLLLEAIERINKINPDVVIVTGDVTENGYHMEFELAEEFLRMIESPMMIVPGNHDARHVGNESFQEIIHRRYGTLNLKNNDIKVIGMDSSEPDLNYGKIGRSQQGRMEKELKKAKKKNLYKIIALHHHIIPVPKTGRERNVLTDAGDILKSVIDGKADIVLSGHKHVPHVWLVENTAFVTAGTVSSLKLRGRDLPSFNIINISDETIEIVLNQLGGKSKCIAKYKNSCKIN